MSLSEWIIDHIGGRTMLYITCNHDNNIDLARDEVHYLVLKVVICGKYINLYIKKH